jgi:hypothetical protein
MAQAKAKAKARTMTHLVQASLTIFTCDHHNSFIVKAPPLTNFVFVDGNIKLIVQEHIKTLAYPMKL